jgi:transcriptional regulator with XRE-family HTH domain
MVGDEAKAAYSRTYVHEYRRAWDKDWPYLCEMLEIIEAERSYDKPWLKDGVPMPTYPTFEAYCEAEVEPFVGPIANLREQYRQFKNGSVDVEGGAQNQKRAQEEARDNSIERCCHAYYELRKEGVSDPSQRQVSSRSGLSPGWVAKIWQEVKETLPVLTTVGKIGSTTKRGPTQAQRAAALGVSDEQLRRIDAVAKHPDLQKRTMLPKSDPQHLSIAKAFLGASLREGRRPDPVEPIRRAMMKLDQNDRRRAIEWVISWAKENGDVNDAS